MKLYNLDIHLILLLMSTINKTYISISAKEVTHQSRPKLVYISVSSALSGLTPVTSITDNAYKNKIVTHTIWTEDRKPAHCKNVVWQLRKKYDECVSSCSCSNNKVLSHWCCHQIVKVYVGSLTHCTYNLFHINLQRYLHIFSGHPTWHGVGAWDDLNPPLEQQLLWNFYFIFTLSFSESFIMFSA